MTRFKELERIERAIETGADAELRWAAEYCEMRLGRSRLSQHEKHWRSLLARIRSKMAESPFSSRHD